MFTIFVNDFETYLKNHCEVLSFPPNSLESDPDFDEEEIFALPYADDTIVLTESEEDMQKALNAAFYYCSKFSIRINCSKTKNMTFSIKCEVGVRPGDNLSPLMFTIFVNDFETYLKNYCEVLSFPPNSLESDPDFDEGEIFALPYADDTIVLTESEEDMQKALNAAFHYCSKFSIRINCSKTKNMTFSRGKVMFINNNPKERVDSFSYLWVIFQNNITLHLTKR